MLMMLAMMLIGRWCLLCLRIGAHLACVADDDAGDDADDNGDDAGDDGDGAGVDVAWQMVNGF